MQCILWCIVQVRVGGIILNETNKNIRNKKIRKALLQFMCHIHMAVSYHSTGTESLKLNAMCDASEAG